MDLRDKYSFDEVFTIGEVLEELLGWGNGSGEELYEWLADRIGHGAAKETMNFLELASNKK